MQIGKIIEIRFFPKKEPLRRKDPKPIEEPIPVTIPVRKPAEVPVERPEQQQNQ